MGFALLLLFVLLFLSAQSAAAVEINVADLRPAVVKITTNANGNYRTGSGFVFRLEATAAYIVTVSHVVAGNKVSVVFFSDPYRTFHAEILARESEEDPNGFAVLKVQGDIPQGVGPLFVDSSSPVNPGESLHLIGFPSASQGPRIIRGIMSGQEGKQIVFEPGVDEGLSGGPLLRGGSVIAVVTRTDGNFSYAIPAKILEITLAGWQFESNQFYLSEIDASLKELIEEKFESWTSTPAGGKKKIYVSYLSFMDGVTKTHFLPEEAKLINEAVRDGMQDAADNDPNIIVNDPHHTVPNTDSNVNQLIDIWFNPNLPNDEKYATAVSNLMNPYGVDILITGIVVDGGSLIQVRPMGISKPDKTIKTKDLWYDNRNALFVSVDGRLALSARAHEEIERAVKEIIEGV